MARPTRPSDRLRDLVLLARTDLPRAAGHRPPPAIQYAVAGGSRLLGASVHVWMTGHSAC